MATSGGLIPGSSSDPVAGQVLSYQPYLPSSNTSVTTSSQTFVAADGTNLVYNFTAPPSGNVRCGGNCYMTVATPGDVIAIGLLNVTGGAQIGPSQFMTNTSAYGRFGWDLEVTALTPGTAYSFDLAYCDPSAAVSVTLRYGNNGGTGGPGAFGPIVLYVVAA